MITKHKIFTRNNAENDMNTGYTTEDCGKFPEASNTVGYILY